MRHGLRAAAGPVGLIAMLALLAGCSGGNEARPLELQVLDAGRATIAERAARQIRQATSPQTQQPEPTATPTQQPVVQQQPADQPSDTVQPTTAQTPPARQPATQPSAPINETIRRVTTAPPSQYENEQRRSHPLGASDGR